MQKNRNGLLEIYRIFLCFWAMYAHDFFFFKDYHGAFPNAPLTVDFFFIISGFFLISSMQKLKEEKPLLGAWKLMRSRLKPISFSMLFAVAFNAVCMILFIRADYFGVLFTNFCYWWYILYLVIGIAIFYLVFCLIKSKTAYAVFLALLVVAMGTLHYVMEIGIFDVYPLSYVVRTFACIAVGMLCSYIPKWKPKKFNFNAVFVAILIPTIFYLAYIPKDYWLRIDLIVMFAGLVYFSANVNVGGKFFNFIGKLSSRMYVYMAFVSMICVLGTTNHRFLFVVDLFISILDLLFFTYYKKYKTLQKKIENLT